jgi:NADPH:quinone reductase-like Zn-dependent oxidoreductase
MRAARAVVKPADVTFEQAAAVPVAGLTALQGLRDAGRIAAGQRVLVTGAGGGVGTFAVRLARHFGASVTGVCGPGNVELVRSLGADAVIDYTTTDWTQSGQRYDLVLDLAGDHSIAARRHALTPRGTLVLIGGPKTNRWVGPGGQLLRALMVSPFVGQRLVGKLATNNADDLALLIGLVAAGTVTPVIGRTCPLPEVPHALARVGTGHARGKTVITV